ncbi:MAG: hypothetical protein HY760_07625 [Nitrospirae bacterium]|nr:hypothetical protein [Nitrospirota bacterium]
MFDLLIGGGALILAGMILIRILGVQFTLPAAVGGILLLVLTRRRFQDLRIEAVALRVDERLALREGLITALEFRESRNPMAPLLIQRMADRLAAVRPFQVFPLILPRILWTWPFLLLPLVLDGGGILDLSDIGFPHPPAPAWERSSTGIQETGTFPDGGRRGNGMGGEGKVLTADDRFPHGTREVRGTAGRGSSPGEDSEGLLLRREREVVTPADPRSLHPPPSGIGIAEGPREKPYHSGRGGMDAVRVGESGVSTGPGRAGGAREREAVLGIGSASVTPEEGGPGGGTGKIGKVSPLGVRRSARETLPISLRKDLPEAYRTYVTRYWDTVVEGYEAHESR